MSRSRVAVVGAGVGGLVAAIELAHAGIETVLLERQPRVGGKLREVAAGGRSIDSGPTVLTMRWVFDELFDAVGDDFARRVTLQPASVLARHAWDESGHLDLCADPQETSDAIGRFAGSAEAAGYVSLCRRAGQLFGALDRAFLRRPRPRGPLGLMLAAGLGGTVAMSRTSPFKTLWDVLCEHFRDPRLRQLFGRYATYCGASPFAAPATLLLISHVEQLGVWFVEGGMQRLADALEQLAVRCGVEVRCSETVARVDVAQGAVTGIRCTSGEAIAVDAVVCNADTAALSLGLLGRDARTAVAAGSRRARSLSAITWSCMARCRDFPLRHHNVFFSDDYAHEFDVLMGADLPDDPTVYVCAQDRETALEPAPGAAERLFILINAPAVGDSRAFSEEDIQRCRIRTLERLRRAGLSLTMSETECSATTPRDFATRFPGTGGALYGPAMHGWRAAFQRPGSRTAIGGLYLAGGSVHPGPGLPMAALSGRLAAATLIADSASSVRYRTTVMHGGT